MPVTDFIQRTEDLLDFAASRLQGGSSWFVSKAPGSDMKRALKSIPSLKLPAALISYSSSSYGDRPRRRAKLSILVAAEISSESSHATARELMDKAVSLIDGQRLEQAVFRASSDHVADCGSGIAAFFIEFTVEDS